MVIFENLKVNYANGNAWKLIDIAYRIVSLPFKKSVKTDKHNGALNDS